MKTLEKMLTGAHATVSIFPLVFASRNEEIDM